MRRCKTTFFSNKVRLSDYITLNENDLFIRNEYKIANIFNTVCVNIAPNPGIEIDHQYLSNVSNISDPVEKAIRKYQNHPSISIINKMVSSVENKASFSFIYVIAHDISKEITWLDIINEIVSDVENKASLSFICVIEDDISNKIKRLDIKKRTQESDIPTKIIKQFPNLFENFL